MGEYIILSGYLLKDTFGQVGNLPHPTAGPGLWTVMRTLFLSVDLGLEQG